MSDDMCYNFDKEENLLRLIRDTKYGVFAEGQIVFHEYKETIGFVFHTPMCLSLII